MRAFHNDPAVKRTYLARVRAHAQANEIIHGKYWENGKGCAVGCTVHSSDHAAAAAAAAAVRKNHYEIMANKLLELLKHAKVKA